MRRMESELYYVWIIGLLRQPPSSQQLQQSSLPVTTDQASVLHRRWNHTSYIHPAISIHLKHRHHCHCRLLGLTHRSLRPRQLEVWLVLSAIHLLAPCDRLVQRPQALTKQLLCRSIYSQRLIICTASGSYIQYFTLISMDLVSEINAFIHSLSKTMRKCDWIAVM